MRTVCSTEASYLNVPLNFMLSIETTGLVTGCVNSPQSHSLLGGKTHSFAKLGTFVEGKQAKVQKMCAQEI